MKLTDTTQRLETIEKNKAKNLAGMTDLISTNDDLNDTNIALNRKLAVIKTENQKSVERCLQMEIDIETWKVNELGILSKPAIWNCS